MKFPIYTYETIVFLLSSLMSIHFVTGNPQSVFACSKRGWQSRWEIEKWYVFYNFDHFRWNESQGHMSLARLICCYKELNRTRSNIAFPASTLICVYLLKIYVYRYTQKNMDLFGFLSVCLCVISFFVSI